MSPLDAGLGAALPGARVSPGSSARDELLASVSIPTPAEAPIVPNPAEAPAMPPDQPEIAPVRDPEPATAPSPVQDPQPTEVPRQARAAPLAFAAPPAWAFLWAVPAGLAAAWWRHWFAARVGPGR